MAVKVDLLPSYSIGRYFQLAALALYKPMLVRESLILDRADEYFQLIKSVLERIVELKTGSRIVLTPSSWCELIRGLSDKIEKPRFKYNWTVDSDFAKKLETETVRDCEVSDGDVYHLIVLYLKKVSEKGVSAMRVKLPMLLRSTVFGRVRGPHAVEIEETSIDSVGLAILGSLASYLGRIKIGKSSYEYYIIPDGSYSSLNYFAPILEVLGGALGEGRYSIPAVISKSLINAGGISLDLASYLAALINLLRSAEVTERALGLASNRAFESILLTRLEVSENRPQVAWIGSLTISEALINIKEKGLDAVLRKLYQLIQEGIGVRGLTTAVSTCLNSISVAILVATTGPTRSSALLDCARSLAPLLDERDVPKELKDLVRSTLESLMRG
ncbi:MAG: hypothetical protein QW503_03310 [Sulfolobales archaeon]